MKACGTFKRQHIAIIIVKEKINRNGEKDWLKLFPSYFSGQNVSLEKSNFTKFHVCIRFITVSCLLQLQIFVGSYLKDVLVKKNKIKKVRRGELRF